MNLYECLLWISVVARGYLIHANNHALVTKTSSIHRERFTVTKLEKNHKKQCCVRCLFENSRKSALLQVCYIFPSKAPVSYLARVEVGSNHVARPVRFASSMTSASYPSLSNKWAWTLMSVDMFHLSLKSLPIVMSSPVISVILSFCDAFKAALSKLEEKCWELCLPFESWLQFQ
jgi:hypothetical protein